MEALYLQLENVMLYDDYLRKMFLLKIKYFSTICHSGLSVKNDGQHLEDKDYFLLHSHLDSHAF